MQINNQQDFVNKFQEFKKQFEQQNPNMTPRDVVQKMLESGRMSQTQFNQLRNIANQMLGTQY